MKLVSTIKCPYCGHERKELMPANYKLQTYTCENCKEELIPKPDDDCVFYSYGSVKCPMKQ